ncbi:coagulation factor VIIi isoform X2 [Silurus meridionalis]|uniref:coagulation factor VIIi isoform X2 n=1 Tax=Silurus meridionalis TaxID=175797 RepID=UPI001EE9CCD0|nr:coagulation factor VIIi isoform X2 [Silurus meridionalis]
MKNRSLLAFFLFSHVVSAAVFLKRNDASSVLRRSRRANTGILEELKAGNLERECLEEVCDYEEAREVFEDDLVTNQFWISYHGFEDSLKCVYLNGGCEQFCDGSGRRRKCACAPGYALGEDSKSCVPQVKYPCGKAPLQLTHSVFPRAVGGNQCPKGHCPWQVLLTYDGKNLCGGVLVDTKWILTAAHCVYNRDVKHLKVITGEHNIDMVDGNEQTFSVSLAVIHESYNPASGDSDLALLELSKPATLSNYTVPICLPNSDFAKMELDAARFHVVSGWGRHTEGGNNPSNQSFRNLSPVLRMLTVPFLPKPECTIKSGVNVTDNMLCAGYFEGSQESCRGDDGSPLTTQYKDTHFLTGIVSWGKGCDNPGYYTIYTKVANFLDWIQHAMATQTAKDSFSFNLEDALSMHY